MEICEQNSFPREKLPSVLDIKNKIRVGHNECCNCCCCKPAEFVAYKYIQPEKPKSFKPLRTYAKSDEPLEGCTTYKLSFWPNPPVATKPILPKGCLGIPDCPLSDDTTHKMSYTGNWCVKQQQAIKPCVRNWFGRGPMDDKTVQKKDFTWKCGRKLDPIKYTGNLCLPRGHLEDNTTYKMSFYESACRDPVKSFKPVRTYDCSGEPIQDFTTYRLSFFPREPPTKEKNPWQKKLEYHQPITPIDDHTTYKLSYWPHCEERRKPIKHQAYNNLLNRTCCFDDNTTYCLSYFGGCAGDRPKPVLPKGHKLFDDCPITHDTINKLSYYGNWSPKPEKSIKPCERQLLGRGPIQDVTTQKCDFTWKSCGPEAPIRPEGNLALSQAPLECCTTNRLSYLPNCGECVIQSKSYKPLREYKPSDEPMDLDTTMQLSYQRREGEPNEKRKKPEYQKPTTSLDDNTTYGLSFIPPGKLVPCCPGETSNVREPCCPSSKFCSSSICPPAPEADTRPCISC